jgi:hypothetical protein
MFRTRGLALAAAAGALAVCHSAAVARNAGAELFALGAVTLGQPLPRDVAVEPEEGDEFWEIQPGWFHQAELATIGGRDFDVLYRVVNDVVAEIYLRGFAEGNSAACGMILQDLAAPYGPFEGPVTRTEIGDDDLVRGVGLTEMGRAEFEFTPHVPKLRQALRKSAPGRVLEFMAFSMDDVCFELQISYRLE